MPDITLKRAWIETQKTLQTAAIDSPTLDARMLVEHATGKTRSDILFDAEYTLAVSEEASLKSFIERRLAHEPVAKIVGYKEFYGRNFHVTKDTLDPRPDTETLIDTVLKTVPDKTAPLRILDLGTGTGCLLLTLLAELPNATGIGVDISPKALAVAEQNIQKLGLSDRAAFLKSRWCEGVEGQFDILVSNPPYIETSTISGLPPEVAEHEPRLALDGGKDGLDCYREITHQWGRVMAPGGFAAVEIGQGQQNDVAGIIKAAGYNILEIVNDLAGIPRCITCNH